MELTLNGERVVAEPREGQSLLELLRETCGLRSMKDGCAPEGSCGACTVIVDGRAVVSCAQPAERVAGRRSSRRSRAWPMTSGSSGPMPSAPPAPRSAASARPGIVMKAEALLRQEAEPGRATRSRGPCAATSAAARATSRSSMRSSRWRQPGAAAPARLDRGGRVGARAPRVPGARARARRQAVRGRPCRARHAPRRTALLGASARASFVRIDTAAARAAPGVVAVVTAADVPGERLQGLIHADWRAVRGRGRDDALCRGRAGRGRRGESRHAAREAAALVEVEYEVLEPVTDPFEAMAAARPRCTTSGNVLSCPRSVTARATSPPPPA